jgi:hypothetical protein
VLTVEVVRITPAINQRKVFRVRLAIKQRRTDLRSPMPVGNVQTAHPVPPLPALKFGKGSQRDACLFYLGQDRIILLKEGASQPQPPPLPTGLDALRADRKCHIRPVRNHDAGS